uniref:putative Ig domain-containing protein n=1 Tax=Flavicella sediminum TaxID=2585141 RepID=UPI00111EC962
MKKNLLIFRKSLVLLGFFLVTSVAFASHFRYGDISYRVDGNDPTGRTIIFKANTGWRCCPGVYLQFTGDSYGSIGSVPQNLTGNANGAEYYSGEISYTFPADGSYKVYYSGGAKIGGLSNNANGSWYVYTTVNVGSGNNSPVTSVPAIVNVQVGLPTATFAIPVADPDGDSVTYRLATTADGWNGTQPSGLSINPTTGQINWSTQNTSIGQLWNTAVVIRDSKGSEILVDFIMQITQQSNPPEFDYNSTPANGFAYQSAPGQTISFPLNAFDTDPGSTVSMFAAGLPIGASVSPAFGAAANPISHVFTWTPTPSQFGQFLINFTAQDNNGVQVATSVSINVSLKPTFDVPPTPASGIHTVYTPGDLISYTVQASDPDPTDVVQIVSVEGKNSMGNPIPIYSGANFSTIPTVASNPTSGTFTWATSAADWGHKHVFFTARDSYGDETIHEINQLINTPPVFASLPVLTADVGQPYSYTVQITDPDQAYGDQISILGISLPTWLTLVDNGNGTATLSGIPTTADAGNNSINVQAEDTHHHVDVRGIVNQFFNIEVNNCSVSATAKNITVQLDASGNATINAADVDNNSIATCGVESLVVSPNLFTCANIGVNTVTLTITDVHGNIASVDAQVTVMDSVAPSVLVKDLVVKLDENGVGLIACADVDNGSLDACGIASAVLNTTNF